MAPINVAIRGSWLPAAICLAGLFMLGCNQRKPETVAYSGEGFTFFYPTDLSILVKTPVEDFQIITLKRSKDVVLELYVGNNPDFPPEDSDKPIDVVTTPSGVIARSVVHARDDGSQDREVLFDLTSGNEWPQYVHCWYNSLSPELAATADKIIESLQTGPPRNTL